ncbi:MAG: division plane positioning ATPase MipZ [Pseudomonadota bacterium]
MKFLYSGVTDYVVVLVSGTKGGSGKSVTAKELVLIAANLGIQTSIVDRDAQGTSIKFMEKRQKLIEEGKKNGNALGDLVMPRAKSLEGRLPSELIAAEAKAGSKFIVVDLAGRDDELVRDALKSVDAVVTPIRPTGEDLEEAEKFDEVVGAMWPNCPRLKAAFFMISQAPTHGVRKKNQLPMAIKHLQSEKIQFINLMDMAISDRYQFVKASSDGNKFSVTELEGGGQAVREVYGVFERITDAVMSETLNERAA